MSIICQLIHLGEITMIEMTRKNKLILFTAALALMLSLTNVVSAQTPTPRSVTDDEVNVVARDLYCPVCENIPLDVCGTKACAQWRELIREKLALGWDEKAVQDYFALNYGDRVLSEPPREGLNWLVYILPPVIILAGAALVWKVLRGGRKTASANPGPSPAVQQDQYTEQIEAELRRRQKQG